MNEKDEEKYLAILYKNFDGYRVDDWITIANACKKLVEYYGGQEKLAKKIKRSREHIREIIKLIELPKAVQSLLKTGEISKETAWRISADIKNDSDRIKIAQWVRGMNAHDARELIYYFKKNPQINIDEYKEKILKSKDRAENFSVVVIPFPEIMFKDLKSASKELHLTPQKLIVEIVDKFLREKK